MVATVTYDRQTINHPSPISRFAHRSRVRVAVRMLMSLTPRGGAVIDYGCGPGLIPDQLVATGHTDQVYGYEPFMAIELQKVGRIVTLDEVHSSSIDTVSSFETLEHLEDEDIRGFIAWSSQDHQAGRPAAGVRPDHGGADGLRQGVDPGDSVPAAL